MNLSDLKNVVDKLTMDLKQDDPKISFVIENSNNTEILGVMSIEQLTSVYPSDNRSITIKLRAGYKV